MGRVAQTGLLALLLSACSFDPSGLAPSPTGPDLSDAPESGVDSPRPPEAGSDAVTSDLRPPRPDGAADLQPPPDLAPPPDLGPCPAECTGGCPGGVCVIDCLKNNSCNKGLTCPANIPCQVNCSGFKACNGAVDCSAASSCLISCKGDQSCQSLVSCGGAVCEISCSGTSSCAAGVDCSGAQACSVACGGPGRDEACNGPVVCGLGMCTVQCIGFNACFSGVDCTNACGCAISCSGTESCAGGLSCPAKCLGCGLLDGCTC